MTPTRPLRVLHVGKFYAPVEGGIENVVKELATGFCSGSAIESSVLVTQQHGTSSHDVVEGVPVHRVASWGTLFAMPLSPMFPGVVERMASQFDIVHVHLPNPLPFFCNWNKVRRTGTRLVVHHHSDIVRPVQVKLLRLLRFHERRSYRAADAIVTTSQSLLQSSGTLAPYRSKCHVLPLSIDLTAQRQQPLSVRVQIRTRLQYEEDDVVFLFLGRLVYYKGVDDLLRAAALATAVKDNVRILIGGDGPLREELTHLAQELGLGDKVRFLGRVPEQELPKIFAAADAFVLPSNQASEAFGVVQLEAMANGLPIINTALPTGVPEVSLHDVTGLTVPPHDPTALSVALVTLAQDASLRRRFSEAALVRVHRFDRQKILADLQTLYRNVALVPMKKSNGTRGFFSKPLNEPLFPGEAGNVQLL